MSDAAGRPTPGANRPRVTIEDVAREANVSVATVSRTLSGRPADVRAATRERVLAAAAHLDYRPSLTARALITGRSQIIGVVLSDIEVPFFTSVGRAIQDAAQESGYLTLVGNSDELPQREEELIAAFIGCTVDGLIISPAEGAHASLSETARGVPIVLVDRLAPGLDVDAVLSDNHGGAVEATRHLLNLGHRRIAYVTDELNKTSTSERLEGYVTAHGEFGLTHDPDLVWVVDYHAAKSTGPIRDLLQEHRPTAIMGAEGSVTLSALLAVQGLALRVPQDISILGFDDLDWSAATQPPLTVVQQDTRVLGRVAMETLLRRLDEAASHEPPTVHRVPTRFLPRASCAPPAPSTEDHHGQHPR